MRRSKQIEEGSPLPVPAKGCLNLIHVADAVNVVLAAQEKALPPALFLVSDGHPTTRRDYYTEMARLMDRPTPQFVEPSPSSSAAQRACASKRIRNTRMIEQLGLTLEYPTYRDGLAAEFPV